jgi:acetyltransferase-like isoleucine patch superfamily enzyme
MLSNIVDGVRTCFFNFLSLAVIILPSKIKIPIYRQLFGYQIGRRVKIGLSWIRVGTMEIGDYVHISSFVRLKNIPEVKIGAYSTIGLGCTFTSSYEFANSQSFIARGNRPFLSIGNHCGIGILHYFDIQDAFVVESFTTIAGKSSVFFTHFIDVATALQSARPIHIGKYCMLGSNVIFSPGAKIADFSVVGMGSVVTKKFSETHCLIAGNPAAIIRKLSVDSAYFKRSRGWIGSYAPPPFF